MYQVYKQFYSAINISNLKPNLLLSRFQLVSCEKRCVENFHIDFCIFFFSSDPLFKNIFYVRTERHHHLYGITYIFSLSFTSFSSYRALVLLLSQNMLNVLIDRFNIFTGKTWNRKFKIYDDRNKKRQ